MKLDDTSRILDLVTIQFVEGYVIFFEDFAADVVFSYLWIIVKFYVDSLWP